MKTTLTTREPLETTRHASGNDIPVRGRRDGRHPSLNLQLFAGLLATLAVMGGCVAQQSLSRKAAERGAIAAVSATEQPAAPSPERAFAARLQAGYLDLAMAAYDREAFAVADFFAKRSIAAADTPPPDPIAPDFNAPPEAALARRALMERLVAGEARRDPEAAARAQLAVDCWLREARTDGAPRVLRDCRREARVAVAALDGEAPVGFAENDALRPAEPSPSLAAVMERWGAVLERSRVAAEARPVAASLRLRGVAAAEALERRAAAPSEAAPIEAIAIEERPAASPRRSDGPAPAAEARAPRARVETAPAIVAFGFDSADLGTAAQAVIAARLADGPPKAASVVLVEGHADASGPASYNLALSQRRADVVAAALRSALGTDDLVIEARGYGETRLAVATADGVREPRNRRVEIRFH